MLYGYQTWSKQLLMQAKNDDDLDGGQRSTEVKYNKQCSMATKLCQKITDDDDNTFIGVKGQQRSNKLNYVLWLPHLVRSIAHTS